MRVFRHAYTDRNTGERRETPKWYVEFRDHNRIRQCWPVFEDAPGTSKGTAQKRTEEFANHLQRLLRSRESNESLTPALRDWIDTMPKRLRDRLLKADLVDAKRLETRRPLIDHLDGVTLEDGSRQPGYRDALTAKGNTPDYVNLTVNRVKRIFTGCRFTYWADLSASRVQHYLAELRTGEGDLSAQSFNYYLQAIKGFCKWMVRDGRAPESPMQHLTGVNVKTDRRHDRRPASIDELRWLLDETERGPARESIDGVDRRMAYLASAVTGLRASELRSLTRASFDLEAEPPTVTVQAGYSKRRRRDSIILQGAYVAELQTYLAKKAPAAPAFRLPPANHVSRMVQADLAAARASWIAEPSTDRERQERSKTEFLVYEDAAGRFLDFHAVGRHTFASLLAASGAHPKTAQELVRHADIRTTMNLYTHSFKGDLVAAVDRLPDLSQRPERQNEKATGTDGKALERRSLRPFDDRRLRRADVLSASSMVPDASKPMGNRGQAEGEKPALEVQNAGFCAQTPKGRGGIRTHEITDLQSVPMASVTVEGADNSTSTPNLALCRPDAIGPVPLGLDALPEPVRLAVLAWERLTSDDQETLIALARGAIRRASQPPTDD